jgi:protein TonB
MKKILLLICALLIAAGSLSATDTPQSNKKGNITFKKARGVSDPILTHRVEPKYPKEALKARISGTVVIEAMIGTDGSVTSAKAVKSDDPLLTEAARDAIKKWKFKPAKNQAGQAVEVLSSITVRFRMK